jgi:hypothetical protein
MELITNSRIKSFLACPRFHLIRYVQGIGSNAPALEAAFGTLMHFGLEAWWRAWMGDGGRPPGRERGEGALADALAAMAEKRGDMADADVAKAQILMAAYDARWTPTMGDYEVIGVEMQFAAPLINPETGRPCRGSKLAGKIDVLLRRVADGTIWIVEHKTSGADLSPGSTYWQRLRMDSQVSLYFAGARALGYEPDGCLYDVIQRPEQRPLQATPMEKRKYLKGKEPTATTPGVLYANQRDRDETLEEFQSRIAILITEAPDAYFARAEIVRLPEELQRFDVDVHEAARQILAAGRTQRGARAVHNTDACHRFGRPCEFFDHCSLGVPLDDPTRFHKLESVHSELNLKPKERAA